MFYSFWRPPTLAPGGACPPSYATARTSLALREPAAWNYKNQPGPTKTSLTPRVRRRHGVMYVCLNIPEVPFQTTLALTLSNDILVACLQLEEEEEKEAEEEEEEKELEEVEQFPTEPVH